MIIHDANDKSMPAPVRELVEAEVARAECESVALLVRKTAWARQLSGNSRHTECPLRSGVGWRLQEAVNHLTSGDSRSAARIVGRDLGHLLLDDQTPTAERLRQAGISSRQWRSATFGALASAASYLAGETWGAWLDRQKLSIRKVTDALGGGDKKKLGGMFRRANTPKATRAAASIRQSTPVGPVPAQIWTIQTVHKVKGREFDGVVFYAPKPHDAHARCPSKEWWDADASSEEREVAFVMASRARRLLVLCVHKETHESLTRSQPAFVRLFDLLGGGR